MGETAPLIMIGPGGAAGKGGMGRMLAYLTDALRAIPEAPRVAVLDSYGPGPKALMPAYVAGCAAGLVLHARAGARVAHIHMADWGSVARKGALVHLAKALGLKVVLHLHGANYVETCAAMGPRARRLHAAMLDRADALVVIGSYWRAFMEDVLRVDPDRLHVIPNGVPDPQPAPGGGEREGGAPRILCLGRLSERKGSGVLIQALADPRLEVMGVEACLAGDGDVGRYRDLAGELGLGRRAALPGWVDAGRAQALLRRADIFVLPSRHEGLPVAIIEAMAHGRAVVATPVGAVPDAITHGVTGLLVPPDEPAVLADALAALARDADLRSRLGEAARARYRARFAIGATARRFLRLYAELGLPPRPVDAASRPADSVFQEA